MASITTTIVNLILAGVLGALAIVIVWQVIYGAFYNATTTLYNGPTGILSALVPMIAPVVGIAVIVLIFMLLTKLT